MLYVPFADLQSAIHRAQTGTRNADHISRAVKRGLALSILSYAVWCGLHQNRNQQCKRRQIDDNGKQCVEQSDQELEASDPAGKQRGASLDARYSIFWNHR